MDDGEEEEEDGFDGCGDDGISIYSDVWVSLMDVNPFPGKSNSDENISEKI